jgi:hypothetical protein
MPFLAQSCSKCTTNMLKCIVAEQYVVASQQSYIQAAGDMPRSKDDELIIWAASSKFPP